MIVDSVQRDELLGVESALTRSSPCCVRRAHGRLVTFTTSDAPQSRRGLSELSNVIVFADGQSARPCWCHH